MGLATYAFSAGNPAIIAIGAVLVILLGIDSRTRWREARSIPLEPNLAGVDLSAAYLRGANVAHCDLSNANLQGADLSNISFVDVTITKAQLDGSSLDESSFDETVDGLTIEQVFAARSTKLTELRSADLSGFDLSGQTVEGLSLWLCNLEGANLVDATFYEVGLRGVDFTGASLEGVRFVSCDLLNAQFDGVDFGMSGAQFTECELIFTTFTASKSSGVMNLFGSLAIEANFSEASYQTLYVNHVDFSGSRLDGLDAQQIGWTEGCEPRWPEGYGPPDDRVSVSADRVPFPFKRRLLTR